MPERTRPRIFGNPTHAQPRQPSMQDPPDQPNTLESESDCLVAYPNFQIGGHLRPQLTHALSKPHPPTPWEGHMMGRTKQLPRPGHYLLELFDLYWEGARRTGLAVRHGITGRQGGDTTETLLNVFDRSCPFWECDGSLGTTVSGQYTTAQRGFGNRRNSRFSVWFHRAARLDRNTFR